MVLENFKTDFKYFPSHALRFAWNTISFAIAFLVFFSFFTLFPVFWTGYQQFFLEHLSFITWEACDSGDYVIFQDNVTNKNHYISTTTVPVATKHGI